MIPDLSPTEWVSIASFSLGLGALVARFFTKHPSAKEHLTTAALIFVIASVAVTTSQSMLRARDATRLAERIVFSIGNQEKTTDQVQVELNFPDPKLFASAMAMLEREGKTVSRVIEVQLPTRQVAPLRLWRVNPTQLQ